MMAEAIEGRAIELPHKILPQIFLTSLTKGSRVPPTPGSYKLDNSIFF